MTDPLPNSDPPSAEPALPMPELSVDGTPPVEDAAPPACPSVACPRCGLETQLAAQCVHCLAWLTTGAGSSPVITYQSFDDRLNKPKLHTLIVAYVLLLVTSLIYAFALHGNKHMTETEQDAWTVGQEVADGIITLSLFIFIGRPVTKRPKPYKRVLAWCLAPLAAIVVFFLADWYVEALRRYIALDWLYRESKMKMTVFEVLTTAVQPAVIEELFFRYFAYGVLRQLTSARSAIILTATMFALAHLYNPLGFPILFLIGVVLGYARAYSGGLLLPMLLHFGHNFAIVCIESMR